MKDNIEDFITEHRSELDQLEPRPEAWQAIQSKMYKPNSSYMWLWKVAAMLLLVTSLALIYERSSIIEKNEVAEITLDNEELNQVEVYYTGLINKKKSEIRLMIQEKELSDVNLLQDLDAMDEMYDGLKIDLGKNTNNEKLIAAMIRNLQLRVKILNKQLEILQQLDKQENNEIII